MKAGGFGWRDVLEVQLAVEEACTNIVLHAYEGRAGIICVSMGVEEDKLKIMIEDVGPPFDPTKHMAMHRLNQDNIEGAVDIGGPGPVGGWGIGLIRALVDEITYERCHGKNIFCLVKKQRMR